MPYPENPLIHLAGMAIATAYEPLHFTHERCFDWSAVDDRTYDGEGCRIGRGATEAEAVVDLLLETREECPDRRDRDWAWQYRLNCLLEDCDSSPFTIAPVHATLRVQQPVPSPWACSFAVGH